MKPVNLITHQVVISVIVKNVLIFVNRKDLVEVVSVKLVLVKLGSTYF